MSRVAIFSAGPPAWSPDGAQIAFLGVRDGNAEVYVMNADGSGQRNLTRSPAHDTDPVWSPDERKIAFLSDRDTPSARWGACPASPCNSEVYVMNADGSGQQNLTRSPANDGWLAWSPRP